MADARVFLRVRLGTNGEMDISPAVSRVDVHDEDRGTDVATVVMDDHAGISTDVVRQDRPIRIEMGWETEHAVLFLGRVKRIDSYARSGEIGRLQFTCHDMSELLNVRPQDDNGVYEGRLDTILSSLATKAGLKIGKVEIDPMPIWPDASGRKLVQRSRTSWAMIQEIARDNNARAFVEVNSLTGNRDAATEAAAVSQLYFYSADAMLAQEPLGKLTLCHGFGSLINFQITQIGAGAMPSSEATVVNPVTGELCTETGPAPAPPPPAAISGGALDQIRAVHGEGAARSAEAGLEVTSASVVPRSDAAVPARATGTPSDCGLARRLIRPDPTRTLGQSATGTAVGTVFLRAKSSVDVEGHSASANGRWYLRRVNHVIEQARSNPRESASLLNVRTYRTTFEASR